MSEANLRAIYELKQAVRASQDGRIERANFSEAVITAALAAGAVIEQSGRFFLPETASSNRESSNRIDQSNCLETQSHFHNSNDPALRQHSLIVEQCTQSDWLSAVVTEITIEQQQTTLSWPEFAGLKLNNSVSAQQDGYLLYHGSRVAILNAGRIIMELGLGCEIAPLAMDRLYRLVIPLNEETELILADVA